MPFGGRDHLRQVDPGEHVRLSFGVCLTYHLASRSRRLRPGRRMTGRRCHSRSSLRMDRGRTSAPNPTRRHRDLFSVFTQPGREPACNRRFAATRAHRSNREDRQAGTKLRRGPNSAKSAPAASTREARCMTCSCVTSLYAKTTVSMRRDRHSASSSASSQIGIPSGYRSPANSAG